MANTAVFDTGPASRTPIATTRNKAGGLAYELESAHLLAQLVCTGTFNGTYYADAKTQVDDLLATLEHVDPEFVAKVAVYGRTNAFMKDTPAFLMAWLSTKEKPWLELAWPRVIDNPKMLSNFAQIIRSNVVGRRSFGTRVQRLMRKTIEGWSAEKQIRTVITGGPTMLDLIRMTHAKPASDAVKQTRSYMAGKPHEAEKLPTLVREWDAFKKDPSGTPPKMDFRQLSSLELSTDQWCDIARNAGWMMTRMNLNTFQRHGVFQDPEMVDLIAARLRDPEEVRSARAFPYQLLSAYLNADVTHKVKNALQDAMEIALENVPELDDELILCPDVSGSMGSPITGYRKGSSSKVRCVDVAGLATAAFLRKTPGATVLPFDGRVHDGIQFNSRDSVVTNAKKISGLGGYATHCWLPLEYAFERKLKAKLVVYVSDNESWSTSYADPGGTKLMRAWERFRSKNKGAKLVRIDISPSGTTQALEREDVLNISGFSDQVFELVSLFAKGSLEGSHWKGLIDARVEL